MRVIAEEATSEGTSTPTAGDPIEQIRRLAALRDQGIVSEEEFERKKELLLRRIG
jgi:Short C-terminal domain